MKPLLRTIASYSVTICIVFLFTLPYAYYFGMNIGFYILLFFLVFIAWKILNNVVFSLLFPMDITILSVVKISDGYYDVAYNYGKERVLENGFQVRIMKAKVVGETILEVLLTTATKSRFQPLFKRLSNKSRSMAVNTEYDIPSLSLTLAGVEMDCYF